MQEVSQKWKDNQNKQLVSEGFVGISLDMTDPEILSDASTEDNGATYFSNTERVIDEVEDGYSMYNTLEQNFWVLDYWGEIIPDEDYDGCGYISEVVSDENGEFSPSPILTIKFTKVHENLITGVVITWSALYEEYPTEFTVTAYNGDTVVAKKDVVGNTSYETNVLLDIVNYDRITVEIKKWCLPHHRARIENIFAGLRLYYDKSNLFSFSHSQEVDIISASLPKSTISFSIDNSSREYDMGNTSGLSKYLLSEQELKVMYGYKEGEWISGGTFYLSGWDAKQNDIKASFEAQDIFGHLTDVYDESVYVEEGKSLYDLAVDVLTFADLRLQKDGSLRWVLDESLKDIITTSPMPMDTVANCLQMIANAGCCVLYQDRRGVIHIEKLKTKSTDYTISQNNSYSKPETSLSKAIKDVVVKVYTPSYDKEGDWQDGRYLISQTRITTDNPNNPDKEYVVVFYHEDILANPLILTQFTSGYTLVSMETKGHKTEFRFKLPTGAYLNALIKLVAHKLEMISNDEVISGGKQGETITIDNPLISTREHAQMVADWVKNTLATRQTMTFNWRADPRLDALDMITSQDKNVMMTKVDYTYNGAFRGSGEGRVM